MTKLGYQALCTVPFMGPSLTLGCMGHCDVVLGALTAVECMDARNQSLWMVNCSTLATH